MTERTLARARAGDQDAFRELTDPYRRELQLHAYRIVGSNEDAARLALQWTGGNRTYAVPYGTEAGIFRAQGISTVICGPGDIAQAHQPNEFVMKSQMDACDAFVGRVIQWAETR